MTVRKGPGRPKGSRNKRTIQQIEAVKASGLTPLEYLVSVYQNEENPETMRLKAASDAAPYVHQRLSAVDMDISSEKNAASDYTLAELEEIENAA